MSRGRAARAAAGAAVLLLGACATVQVPSGGPPDLDPPRVVGQTPDSGAVGVGPLRELRIAFSEKTDRTSARNWLTLFPPVPFAATDWDGRRVARVRLQEPLPADTVVVVEVGPGLKDMHGIAAGRPRNWPLATGPAMPRGRIAGSLVYQAAPAVGAVVELLPADAGARPARQPLRRTVTDSTGSYELAWLPVPGGPWRVRAFVDPNADLRLADSEPSRLVAERVALVAEAPEIDLGLKIIHRPGTPGELEGAAPDTVPWPGALLVFTEPLPPAEATERPPPLHAPRRPRPGSLRPAVAGEPLLLTGVPPGLLRIVFFVDADRDSTVGVLPAAAGGPGHLEPMAIVDSVTVWPGLRTTFAAPAFADTLVPAPPAAAPRRGAAAGRAGEER